MACAGIDFGNKTSVVAIARRGGIDVCVNEVSNRATPSLVSFQSEERHIGEGAASIAAQNHRNTIGSLQRLLGVPHGSPFSAQEAARLSCKLLSHPTTQATAASVHYNGIDQLEGDVERDGDNTIFSMEALSAMLFSKLMESASAEYKAPVRDLVVSVPVYYTHAQRVAVLHAASIANLNVLRVLNEHASIALSYGIFRTKELPEKTPIKVAFVDVGEASTTVSITAFTNTRCQVLAVNSDPCLGGRDLDDIIVNKFAEHFKKTYSIDVLSKPKPSARLRKEAEKIKKILSANPESPLNMECLMDDVDVKGHITRDELEQIAAPLLDRIRTVCERTIADAKLAEGETLTAVELVGGSSRVPAFKAVISEVFSSVSAPIRTTLNADECIARGCALMSAMLSPAFKVRDYTVIDIASNTLMVEKVFTDDTATEVLKLVPKGNMVPCVKVMKFKSPGALTVKVKYEDASALPAGGDQNNLCCGYLIDAPIEPESQVHAKIRVNGSGIVEMSTAQLVKTVKVEEEFVKEVPAPEASVASDKKANGDTNGDTAMPDASGTAKEGEAAGEKPAGEGEPAKEESKDDKMETDGEKPAADASPEKPAATVQVKEKRIVDKVQKTELSITPLEVSGCTMGVDIVTSATEKEAKMKAHDLYIRERSEAMNSLEAYVYDLRSRIDEYSGDLKEFASSSVRDKLKMDLDATEEWIYSEEAEEASKSTFVEKKSELVKRATPMLQRKKEFDERPKRMKVFDNTIESFKQFAMSAEEEYAHIKQEDKDKVMKCCESASVWLKSERVKQESAPKDENPSLSCEMISTKLKEVVAECDPVRKTPKPAPKEEKKSEETDKEADKMETEEADKEKVEEAEEAGNGEPSTTSDQAAETPAAEGQEAQEADAMNGEAKQDEEMK